MKGTWGDTRLFFYCSLEFAREQYVHFSAKRGVARRKRELGDRSRPHPCPKIDPHSCPKQQKQAGVLLGARLLSCLFPFISFNVVPFTLLGDEIHKKFPNGLSAIKTFFLFYRRKGVLLDDELIDGMAFCSLQQKQESLLTILETGMGIHGINNVIAKLLDFYRAKGKSFPIDL